MGAIEQADVRGDLYDLTTQVVKKRQAAADITFFKNAGSAKLKLPLLAYFKPAVPARLYRTDPNVSTFLSCYQDRHGHRPKLR